MADVLLLRPDDADWDRWIGRARADFYHSAAYHRFSEQAGEGTAHLAVYGTAERFVAWPYLRVEIDGSDCADATSVYGYTGPVVGGSHDDAFRREAFAALCSAWRAQGLVTLFTRLHPLLQNRDWCLDLPGDGTPQGASLIELGRTVSIDATLDAETRMSGYPKRMRQELRRAVKAGLEVEVDDEWQHFDRFVELYGATMDKNLAEGRYRFSREYLAGLRAALGAHAHLAVVHCGDAIATALLFVIYDDIAQAHLTGVDERFLPHSPLKLLLHELAGLCHRRGAKVLHLGAGRGGAEDALFAFKARFSDRRHPFTLGRWVLDAERYAALSDAADARAGPPLQPHFFPAYRAPRGVCRQ